MTKTLEFIFDFASPNAYLVHKVLPGLIERTGAKLVYTPCLLGGIFKSTNNQAPMVANANIPKKAAYDMLEFRRFIARHGLNEFKMNPHFPVNTVALMRGAVAAEELGELPQYIEAGLHHMWEDPKPMGDPAIVAEAMTSSSLDGNKLMEMTQEQRIKDRLFENTNHAVERGAFGIPTYFIGEDMYFGKERLGQVEEALTNS